MTVSHKWSAALFFLALSLRLLALVLRGEYLPPAPPPADSVLPAISHIIGNEAGLMASYLAQGKGYASPFTEGTTPSLYLAPAYPTLLAGLIHLQHALGMQPALALAGALSPGAFTFYGALVINLLASALLPVIALRMGPRIGFPPAAAIFAALALCFCPEAMRAVGLVGDEALFTTTAALLVLLMVDLHLRPRKYWHSPAVGAAIGAHSLLNPAFLPAAIVAWTFLSIRRGRFLHALPATALACLFALLVQSPWHLRNAMLPPPDGPAVIPIRGHFRLALWTSANDIQFYRNEDGTRTPIAAHPWRGEETLASGTGFMTESEYYELCERRTNQRMRRGDFFLTPHLFKNAYAFWLGAGEAERWQRSRLLFFIAQGVPAILGIVGLIVAARHIPRAPAFAFLAILVLYPIPYYLAAGTARYRHPIDLVLYLGIGFLACTLFTRHETRPSPGALSPTTPDTSGETVA